jgi:hypothetical protein
LHASIPALAHWRLSTLPRYLQSEDVERVIASCDPTTPVGARDRAAQDSGTSIEPHFRPQSGSSVGSDQRLHPPDGRRSCWRR